MSFVPFEGKRSHSGDPSVSVTKYGNFILNSTCIERYFKDAKYAKLFWDAEHGKVGIKPMKAKDAYAYSLNLSPRGNVGSFSGVAFFKSIGLDYKVTKSYPAEWNKTENLIEFSVKGSIKVAKAGRE